MNQYRAGRVIAIDGPAASGKSTVSRGVANALGFRFVSSGHLYRALAWGALRDKIGDPSNEDSVNTWVTRRVLEIRYDGKGATLFLDAEDVTPRLSDPEVAGIVSRLSAIPSIRDLVNGKLRDLALTHDLVMEGRDIGSVVFPETPYKFYLDASSAERIRRRALEGVVDSIDERDRLDSARAAAPLIISEGATVIDTTHLDADQVVQEVLAHLEDIGGIS
jgi:cytidylate kinase